MRRLQAALDWIAGSLLFLLLVVGILQVGSRYTGVMFVPWTEEVARLLFVWVVWIGAAAALVRGSHIRFDFVIQRLPPRVQVGLGAAVTLGVAGFLGLIIYYAYQIVRATTSTFITFNLSVRYTYLSAVVGASLMLAGLAGGLLFRSAGRKGREDS